MSVLDGQIDLDDVVDDVSVVCDFGLLEGVRGVTLRV